MVRDMTVRRAHAGDEAAIVAYFERNRRHLESSSALRADSFYTVPYWRQALDDAQLGFASDRLMHCFLFRADAAEVVGVVNLSNFVRGAFHACHLGYSIDASLEGTGRMSAAVDAVVQFAFTALGLHRVMANYLLDNVRSERLLHRLGFEKEGVAKAYLLIHGEWRDHVLTARVNHDWKPPSFSTPGTHASLVSSNASGNSR